MTHTCEKDAAVRIYRDLELPEPDLDLQGSDLQGPELNLSLPEPDLGLELPEPDLDLKRSVMPFSASATLQQP